MLNDRIETAVLRRMLARASAVPVNSIKGALGHTMGAAATLEAVMCLLAARDGWIPPTVGFEEPDPACGLDYVPGACRAIRPRHAQHLARLRRLQRCARPGGCGGKQPGVRVEAVGLLTGWDPARRRCPPRRGRRRPSGAVILLARPALDGERFRRATRECLLGVAAVQAMLQDAGLARDTIRGERTALVFVTAAAYGASNVEWLAGQAGTLHFPYTAPSVLPGEVAIEPGLTGPMSF